MKIGIIGLGLIGGSLAIDLKSQNHCILGVSRKETTCKIALEKAIVNQSSTELSILKDAEIVFICTPIDKIAPTLKKLLPYLSSKTIVTDVGSVKSPIVKTCSLLWHNFVGGHPMAGTAEAGIDAAQSNLFKNAAYVFTPHNESVDINKLKELAVSLGAIPYVCEPEIHDRAVAWISHLPVMVSASLIAACTNEVDIKVLELAQQLASSGFRDTSRVGAGNPELGTMMARYNNEYLLQSLYGYRSHLDHIINIIEDKDWNNLAQLLSNNRVRSKFLN